MTRVTEKAPARDSRGYALVIALMALVILTLLGTALMSTVTMNTQGTGHGVRRVQALSLAEAGVAEAQARISSGDIPDNKDPEMVAKIYLCSSGTVPVSGADTVSLATSQASGQWLNYSTAGKGPDVLTVEYKTDASRTKIYRFDPIMSPAVQTASGSPIFVITSTGRRGNASVKVVSEGYFKQISPNLNAVVSGRAHDVKLWCGANDHGPFMYNGMNHRMDTPTWAGTHGPDPENYVGTHDIPGFWSTEAVSWGGNRDVVCCDPVGSPVGVMENQGATNYYAGPWSTLGLAQADFYSIIGTPRTTVPANLNGIIYLDDNAVQRDRHGTWTIPAGAGGEGFLYVDGNLKLGGDFYWRGLIFVEGQVEFGPRTWILGGLVINHPDKLEIQHEQMTFLYSYDALAGCLKNNLGFTPLSWREF